MGSKVSVPRNISIPAKENGSDLAKREQNIQVKEREQLRREEELIQRENELLRKLQDLDQKNSRNAGDSGADTNAAMSAVTSFDEDQDDTEVVRALFLQLDKDADGLISFSELKAYLDSVTDHRELAVALIELFEESSGIDFDSLKSAVQKIPRVPGRVMWSQSLLLEGALARHLHFGSVFDGLSGIKTMTEAEISVACAKFCLELPSLVLTGWRRLKDEGCETAEEVNSKFLMTEGAFTGKFAPLSDFYLGVESKLGQPNPRLASAMAMEHCARANAAAAFITPNYGLCTTPRWEWYWVLDPDGPTSAEDLQRRLLESGGKFPGEIGDCFVETFVTVTVRRTALAGAALADFDKNIRSRLLGELGAILDSDEDRARGIRIIDTAADAAGPARVVVALPMPTDRLAATQLDALRDAVGRCAAVDAGSADSAVEVGAATSRAHVYCEHADSAGLRKALARRRGSDAARAARHSDLSDLPPVVTSTAAAAAPAEPRDLWEALDQEERSAEAARAACANAEDALRSSSGSGRPAAAVESQAIRARKQLADAERRLRQAAVELAVARFSAQTVAWASSGVMRRQGRGRQGSIESFMARPDVHGVVAAAGLQAQEVNASQDSLNIFKKNVFNHAVDASVNSKVAVVVAVLCVRSFWNCAQQHKGTSICRLALVARLRAKFMQDER